MILRGFGQNNTIITKGLGYARKVFSEIIRIVSNFYDKIFLRTYIKPAENIVLRTTFYYNIYLNSSINLVAQEKIMLNSPFTKTIMLKSNIALKK